MKYLVLIFATVFSLFLCSDAMAQNFSQTNLECIGKYDFHSDDNPIHEVIELELTFDNFGAQTVEGQIGESFFSVYSDVNTMTYRAGIYFGPEYTRGTITTGSLQEDERIKLSVVEGNSVFTVICQ